jgi:endonuclease YncB( thermonuclease family)
LLQYQNAGEIPTSAFKKNKIIHGRVEKIIDGDTFRIRCDGRVVARCASYSSMETHPPHLSLYTDTILSIHWVSAVNMTAACQKTPLASASMP